MKLNDFQKKYSHHINYNLSYVNMTYMIKNTEFDFDVFLPSIGKNLQRGLVWNIDQKRALILAILRDKTLEPISVIENRVRGKEGEKNCWQVIDGKQRLTTIISFLNDEFTIVHENKEWFYNDLPEECKKHIRFFDRLRVNVHYDDIKDKISDKTKIDLFEEINWLGTPQDIEHLYSLKNEQMG